MARIEFAPDGKHWQTIKKAKTTINLWDYFNGQDILQQIMYNSYAQFRLIGEDDSIIGQLPRK